jgi:isoamylase
VSSWSQIEGSPQPLGATWLQSEQSYNFALYSRHATNVTLLLYTTNDLINPVHRISLEHLTHESGRIWHYRLALDEIGQARYYAYSIEGPNNPAAEFHAFDPDRVLLDPYATLVFFPPNFRRSASIRRGSNAGRAPLGILSRSATLSNSAFEQMPRHASDTIIYEVHVRGFTRRDNSDVAAEERGTFAGVIEKIPYLKELGITAVELMPVFQYDPDQGNYWGYMPLNFFSPHQGYAVASDTVAARAEFKAMVKALHRAGIEVILDVVYNHSIAKNQEKPR